MSEGMAAAVLHVGRRLVDAMPVFNSIAQSPTGEMMTKERQTTACVSISQIICSLAMNHACVLFSSQVEGTQEASEQHRFFSVNFLELLLACSSYDDIDVVQPTLEIWFFFLEDNSSQNEISWQILDAADQEHYPQWFVERQQIVSDDPEIEAIGDLRREIADTMLSLFSKWPGAPGNSSGDYVSCVKGISQMLSDCKEIALIDALLFLLSYMVELFDVVSSDSDSEDDPDSCQEPPTGGMDILLGVLDSAFNLPIHPLVINGIARKYTTVEERAPLLQELLRFCGNQETKTTQESKGDLLEVTFRVASDVADADFGALCSSILSGLTVRVQSGNPIEVSNCVYMLGRALAGVQDQRHGLVLVNQLWPVVSSSLSQHKAEDVCRRAGVQFFLNVIPHLPREYVHPIETQILDVCLWWYGEGIAPDILTCCSRVISRQRSNKRFQVSVDTAFAGLLSAFRVKLHADADPGSVDRKLSMEDFLTHHREADKLIPEVEHTAAKTAKSEFYLVLDMLGTGNEAGESRPPDSGNVRCRVQFHVGSNAFQARADSGVRKRICDRDCACRSKLPGAQARTLSGAESLGFSVSVSACTTDTNADTSISPMSRRCERRGQRYAGGGLSAWAFGRRAVSCRSLSRCERQDYGGDAALVKAADNGDVACLAGSYSADVNVKGKDGTTALMWSAINGHFDIEQCLVEQCGANVNAKTDDGYTALMAAARQGFVHVVQYLVDCDAAMEAISDGGYVWAATRGHIDIVKYIAGHLRASDVYTTLTWSARVGHVDVILRLATGECGAGVNAQNDQAHTALMWAAQNDHIDMPC
ncbi:hypothetical protein ON010_g14200 [Phytophthora cinnamomi]|nr:hypothetical protein ON010_g14200 [Phytophthora cinnamomi]